MDWWGMFLPRFNRRRLPPESLRPPDPADLDRLAELKELGSRLQLPHPVRAHLRLASEAEGHEVAQLLQRQGFHCQLRAWPDGGWTLTAVTRLIPTPGSITRLREQMEEAVRERGGSYEGWDAPIVN